MEGQESAESYKASASIRCCWLLLMSLQVVMFVTLLGCEQEREPFRVSYSAPVWGEPPGQLLKVFSPSLSLDGEVREGRFEAHLFQGFLLYGGAHTRVTLTLETIEGDAEPVLVLYGPRTRGDIWGRPIESVDEKGKRVTLSRTLNELGEFLVMVSTYNGEAGKYRLEVSCQSGCSAIAPCQERACLDEGACLLGHQIDARGCRVCDCFEECRRPEDCGPSRICVRGQCLEDCQCQDELAMVCGEDGVTYQNACEADCLQVKIVSNGSCSSESCPALDGCMLDCPRGYLVIDECEVCACQEDLCRGCEAGGDAICTRNGLSYTNVCRAECEGEIVANAGYCGDCPVLECRLDCAERYERDADGCLKCECARPVCPVLLAPVCGEDGVTYNNRCEMERSGAVEAFVGACPPLCETTRPCPEGMICSQLNAECRSGDCAGSCILDEATEFDSCLEGSECPLGLQCEGGACRRVSSCSPQYDPVCSSDGRTFFNRCHARSAGVESFQTGECCAEELPSGCELECEYGYALNENGCRSCRCREGPPCKCRVEVLNPVCGSDDVTYTNACLARCAGVWEQTEGACLESP